MWSCYLSTLPWLICSMKVKQPKCNRHCNSLHDLQYYSSIIMIVMCSSCVLLCPPSHDLKQHMIHSEGCVQGLSPFLMNRLKHCCNFKKMQKLWRSIVNILRSSPLSNHNKTGFFVAWLNFAHSKTNSDWHKQSIL